MPRIRDVAAPAAIDVPACGDGVVEGIATLLVTVSNQYASIPTASVAAKESCNPAEEAKVAARQYQPFVSFVAAPLPHVPAATVGAVGAVVSTRSVVAALARPRPPPLSAATAVSRWEPSASPASTVAVQLPSTAAVATATPTEPSSTVIVAPARPAAAPPVRVGVVSLVIPSVEDVPVSLVDTRTGTAGAGAGAVEVVSAVELSLTCAPSVERTARVYEVPLARPLTTQVAAGPGPPPDIVQSCAVEPAGVIVYPVGAGPSAGAVTETVNVVAVAVAARDDGDASTSVVRTPGEVTVASQYPTAGDAPSSVPTAIAAAVRRGPSRRTSTCRGGTPRRTQTRASSTTAPTTPPAVGNKPPTSSSPCGRRASRAAGCESATFQSPVASGSSSGSTSAAGSAGSAGATGSGDGSPSGPSTATGTPKIRSCRSGPGSSGVARATRVYRRAGPPPSALRATGSSAGRARFPPGEQRVGRGSRTTPARSRSAGGTGRETSCGPPAGAVTPAAPCSGLPRECVTQRRPGQVGPARSPGRSRRATPAAVTVRRTGDGAGDVVPRPPGSRAHAAPLRSPV